MQKHSNYYLSWSDFDVHVETIVTATEQQGLKFTGVAGFPRGGLPLAVSLSHRLGIPFLNFNELFKPVHHTKHAHYLLVDDISDSGKTFLHTLAELPVEALVSTAALVRRYNSAFVPRFVGTVIDSDDWIVFPWEQKII